ncbi:MAG: hypothetical protein VX265_01480 [Myxococcota bacterium]|nr:hypothetical protein [Myxococcota bacterium]MEC8425306.1 hypothetical protein [Myxococcota bacterium]
MADDAKQEETNVPAVEAPAGAPTILGHQPSGMRSMLSRPSDVAARPGFRAASNKKSKAQRTKKKKGKKRR